MRLVPSELIIFNVSSESSGAIIVTQLPFVSAVCITGKDSLHVEKLLPNAVRAFCEQTYPTDRRELVVVTDTPLEGDCEGYSIRIINATPGTILGQLRNVGLNNARGSLVIQWDDDDYSHPTRMASQVQAHIERPGLPVFLKRQLTYCPRTDVAFMREFPDRQFPCIPGTILHENSPSRRYPPWDNHDDTEFAQLWPIREWSVIDNPSEMYLRFCWCGNNVSGHDHVMREAADWPRGTRGVSASCRAFLDATLPLYGGLEQQLLAE